MAIQAQLYSYNLGFPFHNSQDFIVDNGCAGAGGFIQPCFVSHQKILHQPQQQQPQMEQHLREGYNEMLWNQNINFLVSNSKANESDNQCPMLNSLGLAAQFENQRQEIDQFIKLQNEKLRVMLQEQKKQQLATMFHKMESKALSLLRQKEEELTQAAKRKLELEDFLRRLEAENQAWRRVAEENEAMVISLNSSLEEMKEKAFYWPNNGFVAEDAESCCDESSKGDSEKREEEGTEENRGGCVGWVRVGDAEEQVTRKMMACKGCNSRTPCFLFLPCRHLSSCKACEPFLEACPVCREPKKSSIETSIF